MSWWHFTLIGVWFGVLIGAVTAEGSPGLFIVLVVVTLLTLGALL